MNLFKKLFKKKKKQNKQENECWYNNYHEKVERNSFSPEAADIGAPFSAEVGSTKSISKRQT